MFPRHKVAGHSCTVKAFLEDILQLKAREEEGKTWGGILEHSRDSGSVKKNNKGQSKAQRGKGLGGKGAEQHCAGGSQDKVGFQMENVGSAALWRMEVGRTEMKAFYLLITKWLATSVRIVPTAGNSPCINKEMEGKKGDVTSKRLSLKKFGSKEKN